MTLTSYDAQAAALDLLADRPLVVLTGAGLSTDSGIPDYRGPGRQGAQAPTPMTYQEFVSGPAAQQRYWARSHVGWARMHGADPNPGHHALAALEPQPERLRLLITQNVDGLHERAGSARLVALHGRIAEVVCLGCGDVTARAALQDRMSALNPGHLERHTEVAARPDGDVALDDTSGFAVPSCTACGGVLKPHVVFFGENVPADRVQHCYAAVDALSTPEADPQTDPEPAPGALLVVGSSLTVMSGLRFVRRAAKLGVPVVIVNRGPTRGDELASHRLEVGCSEFLTALADRLGATLRGA